MQAGSQFPQGFGVWIDYNQDSDFDDATEFVYASPNASQSPFTTSIQIPDSATAGQTRLRVRCRYNAVPLGGESCGVFDYGEAEDYTITLVQPPPCTEPPTVGTFSSSLSVVCDTNTQFTVSLSGGTSGWGQYYEGQYSSDNVNWTNVPGNIIFPASMSESSSTYYRAIAHCGASTDTSNSVFVFLNPEIFLNLTFTNVLCTGDSNGTITAVDSGGTAPFTYLWDTQNSQTTVTATGLRPYIFYTVTMTDASGCVAIGSTQVSEPLQLEVYPDSVNASCGISNGYVYVSANYGTPPYSFNWTGGGTTDTIFNLGAGTYYVTATDNNGCTKTNFTVINETGGPNVPTNVTNITCFGLTDGSISALPEGGLTPYTYLWSNSQTTQNATGLSPAMYFVTVTDALGCNGIASATVGQPDSLYVQFSIDNIQCFGQSSGAAHALDIGGSKPVTFLWSTAETTQDIYSLSPGTYSVTITDNNGCVANASGTVNQPLSAVSPALTAKNVTCYGMCNGVMIGGATGGTPPYSYYIPQTELPSPDSITNLCAGAYQVQVTDANSCMVPDSIFITEPAVIVVNAGNDTSLCIGIGASLNGSATGGVPPYTYSWSPSSGLSNPNIFNPTANPSVNTSYSLYVTDSNNCTGSDGMNFTVNPAPSVSPTTIVNVSCNGGNNGSIYTSVSGGTGSYTYLWSNSATVANINTLVAGAYSVTVTDSLGCTGDISVNITEPAVLVADGGTGQSTCSGFPVTIGGSPTANGGTAPYTYNWDPSTGLTSAIVANPDASPSVTTNYSLAVTDNNGCVDSGFVTVTVITPSAEVCDGIDNDCNGQIDEGIVLSSAAGPDQSLCDATTTTLSANTPSDGTGIWSVISGTATISNPTTPTSGVIGLTPGASATLRWTVSGGTCTSAMDDIIITIDNSPSANAGADASVCEGSLYNVVGTIGGSASSATWSSSGGGTFDNPNLLSAVYTPSAGDISAGVVTLTLTTNDPAGACTASSDAMTLSINLLPSATITQGGSVVFCQGGTVTLFATATTSYQWSTGATSQSIIVSATGSYIVTVTNANGCSKVSVPKDVTVNPLPTPTITAGGATTFCTGGSVTLTSSAASSYSWSSSETTQAITKSASGDYTVTVTDGNGCTGVSAATTVIVNSLPPVNAGADVSLCNGSSATLSGSGANSYTWDNGVSDGVSFVPSSTITYSVTGTDANGCSNTDSATISVNALPTTSISGTTTICNGQSTSLTASGGTNYNWSTTETTAGISVAPTSNTSYFVTVTDGNGCTANDSATVIVNLLPTANISGTTTICNGQSTSLTASGGTNYNWSTTETTAGISVSPTSDTQYDVTVTDGNGCTGTASQLVTVNAIPSVTITPSGSTTFCQGGTVTLNSSAANSYIWSNGATTQSITVSSTGNYALTVTDVNGCVGNSSFVPVTMNVNPTVTFSTTNPSCNGSCNGSVISFASGSSPFSYLWSNSATGSGISALCIGTYSLTLTDVNGCSVIDSASLTEPSLITTSISFTNASCNGTANGSATVTASGGTGSLTYIWANGQTTPTATGLNAGLHFITVTDANSCSVTDSIAISEPSAVTISINTINASCNGVADGKVSVNKSGGTSPYSVLWSNTATTDTVLGLAAGPYSVTVTDANGCSATDSTGIAEPSVLYVIPAPIGISCNGGSDGSAYINSDGGGTPPYSYLWSNTATTDSITGLTAGTYYITVTDANSCTDTASVNIPGPPALIATTAATPASCNGTADGSVTVSASGGAFVYTYLWSNAATTDSINGLAAGSYDVTVTDANGCTATANAVVTEPSAVSASAGSTNAGCNGALTGSATVAASGGTSPYSYLWSNAATTDSINALAAGNYDVTVTDANGCTATANAVVTQPSAVSASANSTNANCNGATDGSAIATVSGGTAPYSYLWSNAATTDSINGLAAGSYDVTVTDANGCTVNANAIVTQPPLINMNFQSYNATCNSACDGYAVVIPSGGTTPYTYLWTPAPGSGQGTSSASQLCAGSFTLTIGDNNGCSEDTTFVITEPSILTVSTSSTDATCGASDGTATVTQSGGTSPYSYLWSNTQVNPSISGLASGAYSVTVTDANNCTATDIATVNDLSGPSVTITGTVDANCGGPDGSATISVSGGTSPYIYAWSNGSGGNNLDTVPPGTYSVTVTDFNLCNGVAGVTIGNNGSNPPVVSGNVTIATNGFTVTSGEVRAFRVTSTPGMYDLVATTTIDSSGYYIFNTLLPIGNYLLQAIADTLFFPTSIPTYFGLTHHWDSASVLNITCDTTLIVDLEVISLPPMGGTSDFKGKVIAIGGNKWGVSVGDPVPGVDISLEQIPGGIVARDVTDSVGDYEFLNVPQGKYEIFVDIPGLGMDTTYTLDLTTDDTTVVNLDFFVGDTSIFIEEAVSVAEIKTMDKTEIRIYPNPFNSFTNFEYVLKERNDVKIEVFNLLGERIFVSHNKSQAAGKYVERFDTKELGSTGIYFVKFSIGNRVYSHRIVQTN